jgi:drug/metabolite transporter (DMT)-like permease
MRIAKGGTRAAPARAVAGACACADDGARKPFESIVPPDQPLHVPPPHAGYAAIVPAIVAAAAFAVADVTTKVTLNAEAAPLTMAVFRGLIGLPLLAVFAFIGARPQPLSPPAFRLSLLVGVIFAGNVYFLFEAFARMQVPLTVLVYFTYPLLTGLVAAATGVERLGLAGTVAALAAFAGLALMIGAHPGGVALIGIVFGLLASLARVAVLLITRARLQGADPRLTSVWSMAAATAVFVGLALVLRHWQPPVTAPGWWALLAASVAMVVAVFCVFVSTARIGPFRTALFMNLEPLLATLAAAGFLGETITPVQAFGGAVMIAALVAFQLRR